MNKYAVVVAGGSGIRMGGEVPKQFLPLKNEPVIVHTLRAFLQAYDDLQVILVLPAQHIESGEAIISNTGFASRVTITKGGETRFHSVKNGLAPVQDPAVVFVHDGVRCVVSQQLIARCYEQAIEKGSAIPAVAATDSIRIDEGNSHSIIDRNKVRIIQTPQTFLSSLIIPAFNQPYNKAFTDEATVVEAYGKEVFLVDGEYSNIKITRPVDLLVAEKLMEQ